LSTRVARALFLAARGGRRRLFPPKLETLKNRSALALLTMPSLIGSRRPNP